jgi:hypothetical protein
MNPSHLKNGDDYPLTAAIAQYEYTELASMGSNSKNIEVESSFFFLILLYLIFFPKDKL